MILLELAGVEYRWGSLRWTFDAAWTDRRTRVHARTSGHGSIHDLQTDDGYIGGTGDASVDELVAERIRRVVVLHGAFRALDAAAADQAPSGGLGRLTALEACGMTVPDGDAIRVRAADLSRAKPPRWAWDKRIAIGYLNLLLGNERVGKGTLICWFLAELTHGRLPGDLRNITATVAVVCDEDSWDDVWRLPGSSWNFDGDPTGIVMVRL